PSQEKESPSRCILTSERRPMASSAKGPLDALVFFRPTKGKKTMSSRYRWTAFVLVIASTPAFAQNVTPNSGQSQSQMQKDIADCQAIAQQSAGASATG